MNYKLIDMKVFGDERGKLIAVNAHVTKKKALKSTT